jgi:hypothetical protein
MREVQVNQRQMNIGGIVLTVLLIVGVFILRNRRSNGFIESSQSTLASELVYCSSSDIKPCVVSFSLDEDDNMLVNLLLPDLSFPKFYLQITRGEVEIYYQCQRILAAPNTAHCIGEKLQPGETVYLKLISTRGDILLAEGSLSIIGLAFPTMGVVTPIPEMTASPEFTATVESISTPTPIRSPLRTPTPPSYP